jgi:diguanylate cyclase (GGDEF)-like protein
MADAWSAEKALETLLEVLDHAVLFFDPEGVCRAAGARVGELLGVERSALLGRTRDEVLAQLDVDVPKESAAVIAAPSGISVDVEIGGPRGRTLVWRTAPLESGGRVDVIRDVSGERRVVQRLEEVATVDPLTELPNKRRFEQELDREHRRAQRGWAPYAVARVDVDGMAAINAHHGTDKGDALLRAIGEELRSARREYDLVARTGPDEFAILLPGADPIAAKIVVKRAVKGVLVRMKDTIGGGSVAAGCAVWSPPSTETSGELSSRADQALASARSRGPGSIEIDDGFGQWKDEPADG